VIYFIQAGDAGPIKIGYVTEEDDAFVEMRVRLMQTGNPERLCVLATKFGGLDVERELHARFAEGRIRGEWFRADTPGLAEEIARAKAQDGVTSWMLRDDGEQLCEWCQTRPVRPPRRTLCSDRCAVEKKREDQRVKKEIGA
jgi:hypothetical protein